MRHTNAGQIAAGLALIGMLMGCSSGGATATRDTGVAAPTSAPEVTVAPTLGAGSSVTRAADGMIEMYVPAGEFSMGNDSSSFEREIPAHTVELDAYWIDQTEVTNAMYATCVAADGCAEPKDTKSFTYPEYFANPDFDDYPVVYVSWDMANEYCAWAGGGRLPTEAEWEKAARGTDGRYYPWAGSDTEAPITCDKTNWGNCIGDTSPVGSYEAGKSPYGLYDVAGNVWEWVSDWYDEFYYQKSVSINPPGPGTGKERGLRGGAFDSLESKVRPSYRFSANPLAADYYIGFRCARDDAP